MSTERVERIEQVVDYSSALLFAAAAAFCASRMWPGPGAALAAGVVGACACLALLRSVRPEEQRFTLRVFSASSIPPRLSELLLTDVKPASAQSEEPDELLLDDVLDEPSSESRVVSLFDATTMPTPGELQERIDRHIHAGRAGSAHPDASRELHEALAKLRRSIS